jgi:hypothetical protein
MKKNQISRLITAILCTLTVLSCTLAQASTTQVQADTVMMTTTADTVNVSSTNFGYGARVTGIKLVPYALNKFYRLRVASVSGNILWEHRTTATSDSLSLALDPVNFRIPSTGIYFQTDDAQTTDVRIFLYTDVK